MLRVNGDLLLKKDVVPNCFKAKEDQLLFAPNQIEQIDIEQHNRRQNCKSCNIFKIENDKLKQINFETAANFDVKLQKKDQEIDQLKCKCFDQSLLISGLKNKINLLEKYVVEVETKNKKLREKIMQPTDSVSLQLDLYFCIFFERH